MRAEYHTKLADWFTNTDPRIVAAYNKQCKANNKRRVLAPLEIRPHRPVSPYIQYVPTPAPPPLRAHLCRSVSAAVRSGGDLSS